MVSTKMCNEIQNLRWQIRTRRARGSNPRELDQAELDALQVRVDALTARQKKASAERAVERINRRTMEVVAADGNATRTAVAVDGGATRTALAEHGDAVAAALN